jgi:SAM-dependent methyltransferase
MLLTLSRFAKTCEGFDVSDEAKSAASDLLRRIPSKAVKILGKMPVGRTFDSVHFYEVIGYFPDPAEELRRMGRLLSPDGWLFFSFTALKAKGFAESATGRMRCFSRPEMERLLSTAGLEPVLFWNYGFPLTNILKPFLNLYHRLRAERGSVKTEADRSGLAHKSLLFRLAGWFVNPVTLYPFCLLQTLFRGSDLGTGYIVVARRQR